VTDAAPRAATTADRPWWRLLFGAVLLANLLAYALLFFRYLAFPYEVFGWAGDIILYNASLVAQGEFPWRDPLLHAPVATIYTPLYTLMIAPLMALFGTHPATGRLLTLAGVVLLCVLLVRETRRRTGLRWLAWFAPGVLFLFSSASLDNLLWVHPDAWSAVFVLLAFLALTPRVGASGAAGATGASSDAPPDLSRRAVLLSALWSSAATFTKQPNVGFTVVIAIFLLAHRPRALPLYLGAAAGLLVAAFALMQWACDGGFLAYMQLTRSHSLHFDKLPGVLLWVLRHWGLCLPLLAALLWRRGLRARWNDPLAWALVVGLPPQVATVLADIAVPNNLILVTVVLVPLLLEAVAVLLPLLHGRPGRQAVAGAILAAAMVPSLTENLRPMRRTLQAHDARLAFAHELEGVLVAAQGPVWVSYRIDFAYRNGLPVIQPAILVVDTLPVHPTITDDLLAQIDAGYFELLVLPHEFASVVPEAQWKPRIMKRYRVDRVLGAGVPWGPFTPVTVMRRRE
jgi:hypothetical protein